MKRRPVPVANLEDGETYAFLVDVVDRVGHADAVDTAEHGLRARVSRVFGKRRTSEVWTTRHYAAQGRRRYAELVDYCPSNRLNPDVLTALADPRAMLIIGWCVVRKETS